MRASAGTGKTHSLTNRLLELLLGGAAIEDIFAATFARKAAGEILVRLLRRLAIAADSSNPRMAETLSAELALGTVNTETFRDLLVKVTASLDQLMIGTLDSFFVSWAGSSRFEIGLPAGWSIGNERTLTRLRRIAIQRLLVGDTISNTTADLATLIVQLNGGRLAIGLEKSIEGIVTSLAGVFRDTLPAAWNCLTLPPEISSQDISTAMLEVLAFSFTDSRFTSARDSDIERARALHWDDFVQKGLVAKIVSGDLTYYSKPIDSDVAKAYRPLIEAARSALVGRIVLKTRAMHDMLSLYTQLYDGLVAQEGVVSFDDITRLVGDAVSNGRIDSARWRGIPSHRHLLLDEFQDTSLSQWRILKTIISKAAASEGTFYCVGDEKQAIYGWRGGRSELLEHVGKLFETGPVPLSTRQLTHSYRSSPAILDVVNTIFSAIGSSVALVDHPQVAAQWANEFVPHRADSSKQLLPGWVRLRTSPSGHKKKDTADCVMECAAARASALAHANPGATLGILVRTNRAAERLIAQLQSRYGIIASGEGGNPLADSPAVELILSLFTLIDHPGDSVARFHLSTSPLASMAGLPIFDPLNRGTFHEASDIHRRTLDALRRQLILDGYAAVVDRCIRDLDSHGSPRDRRRLNQLAQQARQWDSGDLGNFERATLRTDDFVSMCRQTSVHDVVPSPIRVMTIHKAKGLEFDLVVLTDLDGKLCIHSPNIAIDREDALSPISGVIAWPSKQVQSLLPSRWQEACDAGPREIVREQIATLYVGLTRAVQGMEIIVAPSEPREKNCPKTLAGVLRTTLCPPGLATPATILYEHTHACLTGCDTLDRPQVTGGATETAFTPNISQCTPIVFRHRSQSEPPRHAPVDIPSNTNKSNIVLADSLLAGPSQATFARGTLIHAWFEKIEWSTTSPNGFDVPDSQTLWEIVAAHSPLLPKDANLEKQFRGMLTIPSVCSHLAQPALSLPDSIVVTGLACGPAEPTLERERAFAVRTPNNGHVVSGKIDRATIWSRHGKPIAAEIVDFKTDFLGVSPDEHTRAIDAKIHLYSPQMEHYRMAVASRLNIDPTHITTTLLFVETGMAVRTLSLSTIST